MELCERALEGGVFAQAIRPPTVPGGTSRLRLSVMANHRADELVAAAHVIADAARGAGHRSPGAEADSRDLAAAAGGLTQRAP